MAANSTVQGPIWPNFEPIRDVMGAFVACNNEEDPFKNEGTRVVTTFLQLLCIGIFPDAQGQLTHKSLIKSR